jgi:hypothetical protein
VSAWNPEKAAQRAQMAYRYVAEVLPKGLPGEARTGYEPLDAHTAAAWEAERTEDMRAFEDALRELMRTAKRESLKAAA